MLGSHTATVVPSLLAERLPLEVYRERAVRIGLLATVLTLAACVIYWLTPGHGSIDTSLYLAFLVMAALGAGIVGLLPWPWLLARPFGIWCLYAWAVADIMLITLAVAVTGGNHSDLYLLYGLTTVFFAASYPPRGQAGLLAFTFVSYAGVLSLQPSGLSVAPVFLRLAAVSLVAHMASFPSSQLMQEMAAHLDARRASDRRSQVLVGVTAAARAMSTLDRQGLLDTAVDAVLAQGFTAAAVCSAAPEASNTASAELRFAVGRIEWAILRSVPEQHRERRASVRGGAACRTTAARPGGPAQTCARNRLDRVSERRGDLRRAGRRRLRGPGQRDRDPGLVAGAHGGDPGRRARGDACRTGGHRGDRAASGADPAGAGDDRLRRRAAAQRGALPRLGAARRRRGARDRRRGHDSLRSPAIAGVTGYTSDEITGSHTSMLMHPDEIPAAGVWLTELLQQPGGSQRRDGTWRWVDVTLTNLLHEPGVEGILANFHDITERIAFQEQLRHQAFHHALTGLPNRAAFHQRVDHALAGAMTRPNALAALFVDLDRFKVVSDSLGHLTGDRLLIEAASRLRDALRSGDSVARLGGDEFTILLDEIEDTDHAARIAAAILTALQQPMSLDRRDLFISATIGIAVRATGAESSGDLIRHADLALYRAKDAGRGRFEVFDAALGANAVARLDLEADLRRALRDGELRPLCQPQVDLRSGQLTGMEALVRWQHPTRGLLSPDTFIPLAEEACRQMRAWQRSAAGMELLHMSVNVSPLEFRQPAFVHGVAAVLQSTGLAANKITLEITESTLLQDAEAALTTLLALKTLGVSLAIDDFRTGYSSLSYLRRYPIDVLKIDQSFVRGVDHDSEAAALVEGIVGLGRTLHLMMVAEGVETPEQESTLQTLGCQLGQGYRYTGPLTAAAMEALLPPGAIAAAAAASTAKPAAA